MRPVSALLRLRTAALLGTASIALVGCERDHTSMLEQAKRARSENHNSQALEILNQILADIAEDTSPGALALRRETLLERGQTFRSSAFTAAAVEDFRLVADQIDPDNPYALVSLASTLVERGDPRLGDYDAAILAADRVLSRSRDSAALIASGAALHQRGRNELGMLRRDLESQSAQLSVGPILANLDLAAGLPESSPRAVSMTRALEKLLELRTLDARERCFETLSNSRRDFRLAAARLSMGLSMEPPNSLAMMNLLAVLARTQQIEVGLPVARLALRVETYSHHPGITTEASRILRAAGLSREAAEILSDFTEEIHWIGTTFETRTLLLDVATETGDPELLKSVLERVRKRFGKDPVSQLLSRMFQYYEARLLEMRGGDETEITDKLRSFVFRAEPETNALLPDAALRLSKRLRKAGRPDEAMRAVDIGLNCDPGSSALLMERAELTISNGTDPLQAAKDVRAAIVADPGRVEELYPVMRAAVQQFLKKFGQTLEGVEAEALAQQKRFPAGFSDGLIYYIFARDYYGIGRYREAAACSLEALARDLAFTPALVTTGLARAKLLETAQARDALARAADSLPRDPDQLREIASSGAAPTDIALSLLKARPQVEGRIAIAQSYLDAGDPMAAGRVLLPLMQNPGAPELARLLAARLLTETPEADLEPLLAGLDPNSQSGIAADQIRLEAALARRDAAGAARVAERLAKVPRSALDLPRLYEALEKARVAGRIDAALPVAQLLSEAGTTTGRTELYHILGHTLSQSGDLKGAAELFDRLAGLHAGAENGLWLGLALHRLGDIAGVAEALQIVRRDWGAAPIDARRGALSALAGRMPSDPEIAALAPRADDPLSIATFAAATFALTGSAPPEAALPNSPWVRELVALVTGSSQAAQQMLRLAVALGGIGGWSEAMEEIRELRAAKDSPILSYFAGLAMRTVPSKRGDASAAFERCAEALPALDNAWRSALDLALEIGDSARADRVASAWATRRPDLPQAQQSAWLREVRRDLAAGARVQVHSQILAEKFAGQRGDFELGLALVDARIASGAPPTSAMEAARELLRLTAVAPARAQRAIPSICKAVEQALPSAAKEAALIGRALKELLPSSSDAVHLSAAAAIAEGHTEDAVAGILEFLSVPERCKSLPTEEIRALSDLLASVHPEGSAQVALLALAARPSDAERWSLLSDRFASVGRLAEIAPLLEAYVLIDGSDAGRAALGRLLSNAKGAPAKALEYLPPDDGSPENCKARMRTLRWLGRTEEAVALADKLSPPPSAPGSASAPASAPAAPRILSHEEAKQVLELALTRLSRGTPEELVRARQLLNGVEAPETLEAPVSLSHLSGLVLHFERALARDARKPRVKPAAPK